MSFCDHQTESRAVVLVAGAQEGEVFPALFTVDVIENALELAGSQ